MKKSNKMPCKCCHSWAASKDSDETEKAERWGFWFAGFGSGPDTVNGTWWSVAILALAVSDAVCGVNPADMLSSGADGLKCTPEAQWNETVFAAYNGSSCFKQVGLQTAYHNLPNSECQSAFTGYRAYTKALGNEYTCNCSQTSPYAFLGGTGGTRPASILSYASSVTNLFIAFLLPIVGSMIDTGDHRRQIFLIGGVGCGISTILGSILGGDMLWVVGLTFTVMTAILYEIMFLGLAPYLAEIASDDAGRGKVAAFRQCGSLSAQLLFVVIIGVIIGLMVYPGDNFKTAISGNVLCFFWVGSCIPLAYMSLGDRKATMKRNGNVITHAFGELFHTFKEAKQYPQTFLFLLMHSMASSGVGSVITQLPTYGVAQLEASGFEISVLVVAILVFAIPTAVCYGFCCANRFKPKHIQIGTICWFILFTLYFALVCNGPGKFVESVIGAIMAGIGFGALFCCR